LFKPLLGDDEVVVAAVQPSDPRIELWVDTAATAPYVIGGQIPGRNKIINGDFSVNQRGLTSSTTAGYGFDRWTRSGNSGPVTYSAQAATAGELPESASTFARVVTTAQTIASDYASLGQQIESVRSLSGKTATISFWAKAASGTPRIALEVQQYFGTGGSPSAVVNTYAGQITLSTAWTRYSLTVAVPSLSGKTVGTANDHYCSVRAYVSAGSDLNARTGSLGLQNNTFDFWGVQVEEGSVATPYEQKSYADELRACQRYFWRTTDYQPNQILWVAQMYTTSAVQWFVPFPVAMRAVPTLGHGGASFFFVLLPGVGGSGGMSAIAIQAPGATKFGANLSGTFGAGTGTAGQAVCIGTSSYLEFSAEL
jgi:hypothetical protein